jgi:hypothetical protein
MVFIKKGILKSKYLVLNYLRKGRPLAAGESAGEEKT